MGVPQSRALRVVVIDDDANWRFMVRRMLRDSPSFEVVGEAADGLEGIDVVRSLRPDIALLDLRMPVMSGEEALPRILEASPGISVVIVSGMDRAMHAPRLLELGADAYLEKGLWRRPFDEMLFDTLQSAAPSTEA